MHILSLEIQFLTVIAVLIIHTDKHTQNGQVSYIFRLPLHYYRQNKLKGFANAIYCYDIDCNKGETTYICKIVYFKLPYIRIVPSKLFASVSATRPYGTIEIT